MDMEAQSTNKETADLRKHSIFAGWKEISLSEIVTSLETGTRPKGGAVGVLGGIPSLSAEHMTNYGKFDFSELRYVPKEFYEKMTRGHIQRNDVLIVKDGATTGKTVFIDEDFPFEKAVINEHVFICRFDLEVADPKYIFYFLWSDEGQKQIKQSFQGAAIGGINQRFVDKVILPLPPLDEQKRIAKQLNEELWAVESARKAAEDQLELLGNLINSYLRQSLQSSTTKMRVGDCLVEVKKGIGETWNQYPVLGATRYGVAPAKEKVGKQPQRYKLVDAGTIFYNPMRINIGSIAMIDEGDKAGITSPDYVVLKGRDGVTHPRWFYYWLRSYYGENFIKTLARGAVRERMLFNRLGKGEIEIPPYEVQSQIAEKLREIRNLEQGIESQLEEINALPSALLERAFAGNL